MKSNYTKLIQAIKLAVPELEIKRRRDYAAGEHAFQHGMRTNILNSEGITGELFSFAEEGHRAYVEYTQAIDTLEDWIEILSDSGVVKDFGQQLELMP